MFPPLVDRLLIRTNIIIDIYDSGSPPKVALEEDKSQELKNSPYLKIISIIL